MAIKAIIFDCFGVLLKQDGILAIFKEFPEYNDEFLRITHQNDIGETTPQQFIKAFHNTCGISENELLKKYFNMSKEFSYDYDVIDWAKQIKSDGIYKVGMLSNVGFNWLDNFLVDMEKINLFDAYILSCKEGISKPDSEIFEMMANRIGCKPDECVMIDDRKSNIIGAKAVGMQGIVFSSLDQGKAELKKILGE